MAHHITLRGRHARFLAADGEPLLEAAERAGVVLPHGCRVGACLTCAARLISGHVAMPPGTALTPQNLHDDIVLPCVAVARTDVELQVGTHVGLLPPLPWTD